MDLDGRFSIFILLAIAAAPVSIATAIHLIGNGSLGLGLFIFFGLPALATVALGVLLRQGFARTFGAALCVSVLVGGLTLVVFLAVLSSSGALS